MPDRRVSGVWNYVRRVAECVAIRGERARSNAFDEINTVHTGIFVS